MSRVKNRHKETTFPAFPDINGHRLKMRQVSVFRCVSLALVKYSCVHEEKLELDLTG